MKVPLSWLKDFVDIELAPRAGPSPDAGRVGGRGDPIRRPGRSRRGGHERHETKVTGLAWDPEKIVVAQVLEVMPHPNADRLVLCRLNDGAAGAYRAHRRAQPVPVQGAGPAARSRSRWLTPERAHACTTGTSRAGADDAQARRRSAGVESYSMVCSEKELGISDEHEGIILLDDEAPAGMPLADYMGDAVFEIDITPNMARNASIAGRGARGGRAHRAEAAPPVAASVAGRAADRRAGVASRSASPS